MASKGQRSDNRLSQLSAVWPRATVLSTLNTFPICKIRVGRNYLAQRAFLVETPVRSLGWEAPLEKEMAIHSSILAWRIPWTEEPGGLQFTQSDIERLTLWLHVHLAQNRCMQLPPWGALPSAQEGRGVLTAPPFPGPLTQVPGPSLEEPVKPN